MYCGWALNCLIAARLSLLFQTFVLKIITQTDDLYDTYLWVIDYDSPISNDDSAWIRFAVSCWDNIFWWTNWSTAHVTSRNIWTMDSKCILVLVIRNQHGKFENLPKFPLLWDTCHGNSPTSAWNFINFLISSNEWIHIHHWT